MNSRHRDLNYREDNDVSLERQRVNTGEAGQDILVIHNLRKSFRRGMSRVVAVDNLSLGVGRGEVKPRSSYQYLLDIVISYSIFNDLFSVLACLE